MPVVEIAYSPNDFYYVSSGVYADIADSCTGYLQNKVVWDDKCCIDNPDKTTCTNWNDNKEGCYNYEVCKNKEYANLANTLENNNGGSTERHSNLQKQYHNEALKTLNISASILLIIYLSVSFFKP